MPTFYICHRHCVGKSSMRRRSHLTLTKHSGDQGLHSAPHVSSQKEKRRNHKTRGGIRERKKTQNCCPVSQEKTSIICKNAIMDSRLRSAIVHMGDIDCNVIQ